MTVVCGGADFSIIQIADEQLFNRDPVISETGLTAWSAYPMREEGEIGSRIYVLMNGRIQPLADPEAARTRSSMRPQTQSNSVVWIAAVSGPVGPDNWILREVPSPARDEPVPELPAEYEFVVDPGGEQRWYDLGEAPKPPEETNVAATAGVAAPTSAVPAVAETVTPEATNVVPEAVTEDTQGAQAAEESPARRLPSGDTEVVLWSFGNPSRRVTRDNRNDLGPSIWGSMIAWQKAKGWPFGWEIMLWADGTMYQLTTNFYYDMAPKVQGNQVVWYGWDGHDFEIYLYDHATKSTMQITSNLYDDVSPAVWNGVVVWEGYAGVDADIFMWQNGEIQKLSNNLEDDLNPSIWKGQVVWQGFDGDDFEIYLFDGEKTFKLTSNRFDDVNPDIRDGLICWMGYHDNWDAEIFVWDGKELSRLTENDFEDRDPRTAGGRIVWQSIQDEKSLIYLASPE